MRLPPFELLPPLPPPHTATISRIQIQSVDAWLLLSPGDARPAVDNGRRLEVEQRLDVVLGERGQRCTVSLS